MILLLFAACFEKTTIDSGTPQDTSTQEPTSEATSEPTQEPSSEASSEPSQEPAQEPSSEASSEPTQEPSQEPPPIITNNGTWYSSNIQVQSDVCNLSNYQDDLTGFAPDSLEIADSDETQFTLMPDNLLCTRNDLEYACETLYFVQEESVLGFRADLQIENDISGVIIDENTITMDYDVTITSCDGWGCNAMELVLTWPCLVELSSDLQK